jgi:glycosyltransferase involved in cell wall biosynthesis
VPTPFHVGAQLRRGRRLSQRPNSDDLPARRQQQAESNEHFIWLEGISDEFLQKVYGASACLLAPSLGEGFGLPLIEVAQKGPPILARELPVFREVAGDHAFYFTGYADGDLSAAVEAWLLLCEEGRVPPSTGMTW